MDNNKPGRDQDILRCPKCNSDYIRLNALHNFAPLSEQLAFNCGDCRESFGNPSIARELDPLGVLRAMLKKMKVSNEPRKIAPEKVEDEFHPVYDCDPAYYLTEDLFHDYKMMLKDFGPDDKDVVAYRKELEKRGVEL